MRRDWRSKFSGCLYESCLSLSSFLSFFLCVISFVDSLFLLSIQSDTFDQLRVTHKKHLPLLKLPWRSLSVCIISLQKIFFSDQSVCVFSSVSQWILDKVWAVSWINSFHVVLMLRSLVMHVHVFLKPPLTWHLVSVFLQNMQKETWPPTESYITWKLYGAGDFMNFILKIKDWLQLTFIL